MVVYLYQQKQIENMKVAEFKNITKNKLNALSIEELKNTLLLINDNFELAGEIIFNTALDLLESKMDENEFISFCDEL